MLGNKEETSNSISNVGILKDPKTGQWLKGTASPNPSGRPVKKRDMLDKLMKIFYGPDCEALFLDMVSIAQYSQLKSKDRVPRFTSQQVARAREFLFEQFYGKPLQDIKAEIETKVLKISIDMPDELKDEDF